MNNEEYDLPWTEKYRPKEFESVVGKYLISYKQLIKLLNYFLLSAFI